MNTIVALSTLEDRKYLRALVFGNLGSGRSAFAHSFPDPILVDATGTLYRREGAADIPVVRTSDLRSIIALAQMIECGAIAPQTLVVDGLGAVQEFLEANSTLKGFDAYAEVRNQLTHLMDVLTALPLHLVFVTRSKNEVARPGDVVGGQIVSVGEQMICGTAPEAHRVLLERFDLVLEMSKNTSNRVIARVDASTLRDVNVDDVFANPDGQALLKRLSLSQQPKRSPDGPPDPETYTRWLRAKSAAKDRGLTEDAYRDLLGECRRAVPSQPNRHLTLAQTTALTETLSSWTANRDDLPVAEASEGVDVPLTAVAA